MARRSPEEVRERVLDAADALFYGQGYTPTGINAILAQAGVAKASFYAHFPTKQHLAAAYLARRHARWFLAFDEVIAQAASPRERALAPFRFLAEWLPSVDYRGCAFLNLLGEGVISDALLRPIAEHKDQLRARFASLAAPLGAPGDALFLLFEGAIVEAQVQRASWPIEAAADAAASLLPAESDLRAQ